MIKRILFLLVTLSLVIGLAACNDADDTIDASNKDTDTEDVDKDKDNEENAQENKVEEDEFAPFEGDIGTFTFIGMYLNDDFDEDSGTYPLDFEGFELDLIPMLVDIELNEEGQYQFDGETHIRAIQLTTEANNTNEHDVDYNGSITVVTSDGDQLSSDSGTLSENPVVQTYFGKVNEIGAFTIPLEDDAEPESINLIISPPYKVEDGKVDPVNGEMGEQQRVEFEFTSREEMEE